MKDLSKRLNRIIPTSDPWHIPVHKKKHIWRTHVHYITFESECYFHSMYCYHSTLTLLCLIPSYMKKKYLWVLSSMISSQNGSKLLTKFYCGRTNKNLCFFATCGILCYSKIHTLTGFTGCLWFAWTTANCSWHWFLILQHIRPIKTVNQHLLSERLYGRHNCKHLSKPIGDHSLYVHSSA